MKGTVLLVITRNARLRGDHECLVFEGRRITHRQFCARVHRVANALLARDRVCRRRAQQRRHGAQQVGARHAQDAAVGRVDIEHVQVGIRDQQPFVQVLEQARGHALSFERLVPILDVGQGRQQARRSAVEPAFDDQQRGLEPAPFAVPLQSRLHLHAPCLAGREFFDGPRARAAQEQGDQPSKPR